MRFDDDHHASCGVNTPLTISVETKRLWIRSVRAEDAQDGITLLSNPVVQRQFKLDPVPETNIKKQFDHWLMDWNHRNPFSAYAIISKSLSAFMGLLVMDYDFSAGFFMSYALDPNHWGKGYGSEAMAVAFQTLIPQLIEEGHWHQQHRRQTVCANF